MIVGEKLFERTFEGRTQKDAYLTCCKWVASNIIAINNCRHVTYSIEKTEQRFPKKVKLTAYVSADEEQIRDHNCEVCQEVGGILYSTEAKYRCYSCKLEPYRRRMKERLEMLKDGMKGGILK